MQKLDLSVNQFTTFPKEIGKLENLQTLNLQRNQLTNLPAEIEQLKNLQELDLNDNQFTVLPKEIGKLKNYKHWIYGITNSQPFLPKSDNYKIYNGCIYRIINFHSKNKKGFESCFH